MGRSLAFLPALLFFAIAPPSWCRSFHGLGSGPPPKHLHPRRFPHGPCQGGRAPMWPESREIRGRPRPPAAGAAWRDARRRTAIRPRRRAPAADGLAISGGGEAGEVGALCATGG